MSVFSKSPKALLLAATLAAPMTIALPAQAVAQDNEDVTVYGEDGPDVEGIISARSGNQLQIMTDDGQPMTVAVDAETKVKAKGGFLGLGSSKLATDALITGLPVKVETIQAGGALLATEITMKNDDLKTAAMIHGGTNQRFTANENAINANAAATEALRGRVGDIDKYNVKGVTNVYFDTGRYNLSDDARTELCSAASQADAMDNALLLVVGYTDNTGSYEINQELSEKRAARVVNYLQQQCGWKPYRMLTPTGMAEADPTADNTTAEGRAQNRRVSVNILVSKSVDGI
ncbi:OmpA family protein [Croceicoccus mobilis]|uniref:OmpA-like domain-containing protein n=1 Tax=Croceicoccus mobilis TaxID=1703339 RepID=A0A917DT08_9SPHN|nr:OmpA family protein [Croceicoccus mobilis]GGD64354.1 hypothetical protein GCM10010990_12280 [Croceicoccus mobilis]